MRRASCQGGCCDTGNHCVALGPSGGCAADLAGQCLAACSAGANDCNFDGGCGCGANPPCASTQRCDTGTGTCVCDSTTCPDGCCGDDGTCHPGKSNDACGNSGASCQACPCDADAGQCTNCNSTNCLNGCCQDGGCLLGDSVDACGQLGGQACRVCSARTADNCASGACRCGGGSACSGTSVCDGGVCVCNAFTCPCCCCTSDGACTSPTSAGSCAPAGLACATCDAKAANMCRSDGTCGCSGQVACQTGQSCNSNGSCSCTNSSCALGCCVGDSCTFYADQSKNDCGTGGGMCGLCPAVTTDRCDTGACLCGTSQACPLNQVCDGGSCVTPCGPSTCPDGCCTAGVCISTSSQTDTQCGSGGETCGTCPHGTCGALGLGKGACVYPLFKNCGNECGTGCCNNTICHSQPDSLFCGGQGQNCNACSGGQSCVPNGGSGTYKCH